MKKLFFLLVSGLPVIAGFVSAQTTELPESVVVADWEKSPGAWNSSSGDQISYTRNPYPEGINTSKGVGSLTHGNNQWTNAEIQAGRLRRAQSNIEPALPSAVFSSFYGSEDIHLGYYDSFEFKQYFPSETMVSGLDSGLKIELRSDGPDRGQDKNVVRENWERQYVTYPTLPVDPNDSSKDLVDQWFKVERGGIVSGRGLGMIQVGFRLGQAAPSGQSEILLDDFIFHRKKSNRICTYRETFYIHLETETSWSGSPNKEIVLYPGKSWEVTLQTGKERWAGHAELKTDFVDFIYEYGSGKDYYLRMNNQSPDILIEDIEILPHLEKLQFEVDVRTRTPKIQYKLDSGEWQDIDFNSSSTVVGATWNTFTFDISTGHADKVALKISSKDVANNYAYIDNLTITGVDERITVGIPGVETAPSILIYPNPVTEILNIEGDVKKTDIYDMQGHLVLSGNQKQINVSHLNAGMYVTKLHTDKGVFSSKVFKK